MDFFRPREIRAILFLSLLVFIGSSLTLLKRQGKLSNLDLNSLLSDDRYNYSYKIDDLPADTLKTGSITSVEVNVEPKNKYQKNQIIDLNSAGYFDFQTLPGIGPVLAERIITYRDSIGSFSSADELLNISGIGEKKYAQIRDRITVK